MIDAIVSAWVGTMILEGAAEAIGDQDSAVWIPRTSALDGGASEAADMGSVAPA
jgi:hypothetical protein